jgi:hypothetical protein
MHDVAPATRRPRRRLAWLVASLFVLALIALAVAFLSRPPRATRLLLGAVGNALGLQITATGGDYRLRGTPMLDVRGVMAREPGAAQPLLRADRIMLSLPWSTIRSGGDELKIDRIELQRPSIDLAALQHWLQRRPPGKTRIPTLTRGLQVTDGILIADGWRITGIAVDLPMLAPDRRVAASVNGRYRGDALQASFALHAELSTPADDAAIGIAGNIDVVRDTWRMPAYIVLSGKLHPTQNGWQLRRARLQASARYEAQGTRVPFALGVAGMLQQRDGRVQLSPAAVAVRGDGVVPRLDAIGDVTAGTALELQLAGALQAWPDDWPQLPPPLSTSRSPLPFRLDYRGEPDLSTPTALQLSRDDVRFDGRFRLTDISTWMAAGTGDPLPPLDGHLVAPRLDVAGASLQGVEVTLDDPDVADAAMR